MFRELFLIRPPNAISLMHGILKPHEILLNDINSWPGTFLCQVTGEKSVPKTRQIFAKHVYLCPETRLSHRHHILLKTDTWSTAIHGWGRLSMDKAFHSSDKFRDETDNSVHQWVHTSMDGPSILGIHFGIHSSTSCTHHHQSSGGF